MARATWPLHYVKAAAADVREHSDYEESKAAGLGRRFLAALHDAKSVVQSNPEAFGRLDEATDLRSLLLRRFPFRLLYVFRGDAILVIAVAHTARRPARPTGQ